MPKNFKKSFMPVARYGDDSLNAFQMKYLNDVCASRTDQCPLGDYQRIMEVEMGLKMKAAQTFLYLPQDDVSPFITRLQKRHNEYGKVIGHRILRYGPEFLHRRFVKINVEGRSCIMPWRCETDYFARVAVNANATELEPAKWNSKYLGLVIDSMATNMVAFDAMKSMYMSSAQLLKGSNVTRSSVLDSLSIKDAKLSKIIAQVGLTDAQIVASLNPRYLFNLFTWDEKWRVAWAIINGLVLYDCVGRPYSPEWEDCQYTPSTYMTNIDEDLNA